ncbi:hypothetical protein GCM10020221_32530 [Streptomyces thioluteus]|uniref:Uncharacterized protein n=1 Tax=Streptomyces thioluteus TaxID=66431 RepID=A0ABN3X368_STRTU
MTPLQRQGASPRYGPFVTHTGHDRKSSLANTAFTNPDHLARTLRTGLRVIQYRSDLIDGCLTGTGLTRNTT